MKHTLTRYTLNQQKTDSELLEMIHTNMKFFTESADGSFALKRKTKDEIRGLLAKTGNI